MGPGIPERPMTGRVWHLYDVLDSILERLGASATAARIDAGEGLLAARARCYQCSMSIACEQLLAAADGQAAYPTFCPNAQFLERCLAMKAAPLTCQRPNTG